MYTQNYCRQTIKPYYNKGAYIPNILPRIPYIVDSPEEFKLKVTATKNVVKATQADTKLTKSSGKSGKMMLRVIMIAMTSHLSETVI